MGICTVEVNGKENQFFYSHTGKVHPMFEYKGTYIGLTQYDNRDNFYVGDEWNYNGNIYYVDEEGHINVPYGEDIFNCLSRPHGKLYERLHGIVREDSNS